MVENHRIRYSRVKHGHRYFEPTPRMKAAGFEARPLGPEGPEARSEAWRLYEDWIKVRKGLAPAPTHTHPINSVGWAWERYRHTEAWAEKRPRTREEWDRAWRWIEPVFADVEPETIEIEHLETLRSIVRKRVSLGEAHRVIKVWRALWRVMSGMRLCAEDTDPSKVIRNTAPKGRSATWAEGEIARLGKEAWRRGYRGLAALLAVAWDTQFAPVDCRSLTPSQRRQDARGAYFETSRGKTGKPVLGTLSRRTTRIVDAYMAQLGLEVLADAPMFRNRSGRPYSKDTLGDDFRDIRAIVFAGDTRRIQDIRRSGAVEALAGEVDPGAMAAKMGNTINKSQALQETYLPRRTATVRLADEARKRGRRVLREND